MQAGEKIDFRKELGAFYKASAKAPATLVVPEFNFLMIDGAGDPNRSPAFPEAVEALFSVSYTARFMHRKASGVDYAVMPLEGLWWADDMSRFSVEDKSDWRWTLMIMQPPMVTPPLIEAAIAAVRDRKGGGALDRLRFVPFAEGRCAQILHLGPFSEEGPTVERLHRHVDALGARTGKHHEIYLSDIRRADPAKWKTIIRQPFA